MTVPDLYRALWRHKLLIIGLTAGLAVAAWYLTSRQHPTYKATTLVRVQQQVKNAAESFQALQTGQRLAQTYARIVTTTTIARQVAEALKAYGVGPREIKLSANQVADLELLSISATHRQRERAQLIANAAPLALRDFIKKTGTTNEHVLTVQPAGLGKPVGPNTQLNVTVAIILGLIFNSGLALLIHMLSDRVDDTEDFERLAGKPVLATVPILELTPRSRTVELSLEPAPAGGTEP